MSQSEEAAKSHAQVVVWVAYGREARVKLRGMERGESQNVMRDLIQVGETLHRHCRVESPGFLSIPNMKNDWGMAIPHQVCLLA